MPLSMEFEEPELELTVRYRRASIWSVISLYTVDHPVMLNYTVCFDCGPGSSRKLRERL
jgi:hypothetical protein